MDEVVEPKPGDSNWTEHVLGLLREDEKWNDYPTANGLRRLTELLVGRITDILSTVIQAPTELSSHRATVTVQVNIEAEDGRMSSFSGSADAGEQNAKEPYSKFPVGMADTRAEGRAFRRALRLNVATAEEMPDFGQKKMDGGSDIPFSDDKPQTESSATKYITSGQVKAIDTVASRFNINVSAVAKKKEFDYTALTYEQAKDILKELQSLQDKVPDDLVGFNSEWSSEF